MFIKNMIKPIFTKNFLIYILSIILSIILLFVGYKYTTKDSKLLSGIDSLNAEKAKVTKIVKVKTVEYDLGGEKPETGEDIAFSAKLISGKNNGKSVIALQSIDPFTGRSFKKVEVGDKVILYELDNKDSEYAYVLGEYLRTDALVVLGVVFLLLLLIFGRFKGFNTILSLLFTGIAVFAVFIPAVLQGFDIYFWSIITCLFIVIMSLLIIYGANKKSLAAGIGCFLGVFISGILTVVMGKLLNLTGLLNEESLYLMRINPSHPIDIKAIIFASILIGALGAIMDISMSIAAALAEFKESLEYSPFNVLVKSGFAIGRDIMGTMTNTLILAYIGSSLSVILLLISYNGSLLELLNKEMIVVELLQALVGSIGILFTIPLTTLICAYLFSERARMIEDNNTDEYTDGWN